MRRACMLLSPALAVALASGAIVPAAVPETAGAAELSEAQLSSFMKVTLSQDLFTWDGVAKEPRVLSVQNYAIDEEALPGTGYEIVGYESNVGIGTGYVVLKSTAAGYEGTWRVPFTIAAPKAGAKIPAKLTSDGNVYRMGEGGSVELARYASSKKTARVGTVRFGGRKFAVARVGAKAFAKTRVVKAVLGPNVGVVGSRAFSGCKKLSGVELGTGVSRIGARAFSGCKKLAKLTVRSAKLTKSGVRGSLRGSKVRTVGCKKVGSVKKAMYKRCFSKGNCGRKVVVR